MDKDMINRRAVLTGLGGALLAPNAAFSQASQALQSTIIQDTQASWVLAALATKHGGQGYIPRFVMVDKVDMTATAYWQGQAVFTADILCGEAKKDQPLDKGISVFRQKRTPAGVFNDVKVIYDPDLKAHQYHRQMMISFTPFNPIGGTLEMLSFHSILNPRRDGANLNDENGENNSVSNGCIRMSYENIERLADFCLGYDHAQFLAAAQESGGLVPVQTQVLILPQEDQGKENTLATLGLNI